MSGSQQHYAKCKNPDADTTYYMILFYNILEKENL